MVHPEIDEGFKDESPKPAQRVKVDIFDRPYWLRSDGDGKYVAELAQYVDALMRDVSDLGHATDSLKVAVVAALIMTDELFSLQQLREEHDAQVATLSTECATVLEQLLDGSIESQHKPADRGWEYQEVFSRPHVRPVTRLASQISSRLKERRVEIQSLLEDTKDAGS